MKNPLSRIVIVTAALACTSSAEAKSPQDVTYTPEQCFSTAQRFVRLDRGCKVVDRDKEAAFLVWECKEATREGKEQTLRGNLEIFGATTERGQMVTRMQVTLSDEPRYMELRFLELLERKLREEYGAQPQPKKPPASDVAPSPSPSPSPPPGTPPTITP